MKLKKTIIYGAIIASLFSLNAFANNKYAYWQAPNDTLRGRDNSEEVTRNAATHKPDVEPATAKPTKSSISKSKTIEPINNNEVKKPVDKKTIDKNPVDKKIVAKKIIDKKPIDKDKAKKPVPKVTECQCVKYVKNRIGDKTSAGNAKDMGPYLIKNGYTRIYSAPRRRDIVIFNPRFGHGFNPYYGHVAVITSAKVSKVGDITVNMVGANMHLPHERTEHYCNNVSNASVVVTPEEKRYVEFYRK